MSTFFSKNDHQEIRPICLSSPVSYMDPLTNFTSYTSNAVTTTATEMLTTLDVADFNKKMSILVSLDNIGLTFWLLFILTAIFLSLILTIVYNMKYGLWELLFTLIMIMFTDITLYFKEKKAASILCIYLFVIIIIRNMVKSLVKTEMVVIDNSLFVDTLEEANRQTDWITGFYSTSTVAKNLTAFGDIFPNLYDGRKSLDEYPASAKLLSDIVSREIPARKVIMMLPTWHKIYAYQGMCTIFQESFRIRTGQYLFEYPTFLWYYKALRAKYRNYLEFL